MSDKGSIIIKKISRISFMIIIIFIAGYFINLLEDEIRFFMQESTLIDIGESPDIDYDKIKHNAYVQLKGIISHKAAKSETGTSIFKQENRYFHVIGTRLFIEETVSDPEDAEVRIHKNITVTGRVVDFTKMTKYFYMVDFLEKELWFNLSKKHYFLILKDEAPKKLNIKIALVFILLLVILVDLIFIVKRIRE